MCGGGGEGGGGAPPLPESRDFHTAQLIFRLDCVRIRQPGHGHCIRTAHLTTSFRLTTQVCPPRLLTVGWLISWWVVGGWLVGWLISWWVVGGWLVGGLVVGGWLVGGWLVGGWLVGGWLVVSWWVVGWLVGG